MRIPSTDQQQWRRYLTTFHSAHAGITEQLFGHLDDSPYEWLVEPLHSETGLILDLACGSAPTRAHLPRHRWVGIDTSRAELAAAAAGGRGPLVRAQAGALPLPDRSARAVCAAMCLQVLTPLTDTLAEVTRVLQPGGVVTALVPARLGLDPAGWLGWVRVLRAVGVLDPPWPNPDARDGLAQILHNHGFAVRTDERRTFTLGLPTPDAVALLIDSLYLPHTDPDRIAKAKHTLVGWTRPGRRLPLPLRRVVAQTTAT